MRDIEEIRAEVQERQHEANLRLEQAIARERRARESGNFRELILAIDGVREAQAYHHFAHV